jgi:hypothetical protein
MRKVGTGLELILLCLAAAAINLPFGFYRAGMRRFSWQWFLAIHFPVPLVIVMRLLSGEGWRVVPLLIACAVLGQLAGGLLRQARGRQGSGGGPLEGYQAERVKVERDEQQ